MQQAALARAVDHASIEIHLPFPPSANHLSERRRDGVTLRRATKYKTWIKDADILSMALHQLRGVKRINGHFTAELIFGAHMRTTNSDADNRIKPVLDWAQSRELVLNDSLCDGGTWKWGRAPYGCHLTLCPVES